MKAKKGDTNNSLTQKNSESEIKISLDTAILCGKKSIWNDEDNLSLPKKFTKSKGYNKGASDKAYKHLLRK